MGKDLEEIDLFTCEGISIATKICQGSQHLSSNPPTSAKECFLNTIHHHHKSLTYDHILNRSVWFTSSDSYFNTHFNFFSLHLGLSSVFFPSTFNQKRLYIIRWFRHEIRYVISCMLPLVHLILIFDILLKTLH